MIVLGVVVAVAAALLASVADLLVWQFTYTDARWFLLAANLAIGASLLLPPLLFLLLVAATCRRLRDAFINGAAHLAALVVTVVAVDFVTSPYQPIVAAEPLEHALEFGLAALLIVVGGPIVGLIAVTIAWLVRTFVWQVVDQDGSRCHRCGYEVAASASAACPECGAAVEEGARIGHHLHRLTCWLGARWRRVVLGVAAMAIGLVGWFAVLERPFVRFERTFAEWERSDQHHPWPTWPHLIWAMSRNRTYAAEGGDDVIHLMLFRRHAAAPTTLRIVVRTAEADDSMTPSARLALGWYGECSFVDVPASARDGILRYGLPEELVEPLVAIARRRRAEEGDWRSLGATEFRWDELTLSQNHDDSAAGTD